MAQISNDPNVDCPGSNRNDPYTVAEATVDVVLPSLCREDKGCVQLVADNIHQPTASWCEQVRPACGYLYWWTGGSLTSWIDAVYNSCQWEFQVLAFSDVEGGACRDNYSEVASGSFGSLTPENYCAIVQGMRFGSGCVQIGGAVFSNTGCANKHEEGHLEFLRLYLEQAANDLGGMDCFRPMQIDCSDARTTSCQSAEDSRNYYIEYEVNRVFREAMQEANQREMYAIRHALDCFLGVARAICEHGRQMGWPSCSDCDF